MLRNLICVNYVYFAIFLYVKKAGKIDSYRISYHSHRKNITPYETISACAQMSVALNTVLQFRLVNLSTYRQKERKKLLQRWIHHLNSDLNLHYGPYASLGCEFLTLHSGH